MINTKKLIIQMKAEYYEEILADDNLLEFCLLYKSWDNKQRFKILTSSCKTFFWNHSYWYNPSPYHKSYNFIECHKWKIVLEYIGNKRFIFKEIIWTSVEE